MDLAVEMPTAMLVVVDMAMTPHWALVAVLVSAQVVAWRAFRALDSRPMDSRAVDLRMGVEMDLMVEAKI